MITIGMRVATERVASLVPTSLEDGNSQPETTGGAICLPARHVPHNPNGVAEAGHAIGRRDKKIAYYNAMNGSSE
jgi:hypothetical protein